MNLECPHPHRTMLHSLFSLSLALLGVNFRERTWWVVFRPLRWPLKGTAGLKPLFSLLLSGHELSCLWGGDLAWLVKNLPLKCEYVSLTSSTYVNKAKSASTHFWAQHWESRDGSCEAHWPASLVWRVVGPIGDLISELKSRQYSWRAAPTAVFLPPHACASRCTHPCSQSKVR